MPSARPAGRRLAPFVVGAVGLATLTTGVGVGPAAAAPDGSGLVISEVYGGGGNSGGAYRSDFIELYNPTADPVDLTSPQLSVQYRSAGSGNPGGSPVALTGVVEPGGHYLIKAADGSDDTQPALPTPDATSSFTMGGSAGQVLLILGTESFTTKGELAGNASLVDAVGYGSQGAGASSEGSPAPAPSNSTSVSRGSDGADTDDNSADFSVGAPTPTSSAGASDDVTAADPGDLELTIDVEITPFDLTATGGTEPYTWSADGLPAGLAISESGTVSGTPTEVGEFPVTATVTDADDASDDVGFTLTVEGPLEPSTIAEIQGEGTESPLVGEEVLVRGVVTAVPQFLYGFYLQTPGSGATAGEASEGVFVYYPNGSGDITVEPGDHVEVTGEVSEYAGQTQVVTSEEQVATLEEDADPVVAYSGDWPADDASKEALEGMLFDASAHDFTVTNTYSTNQYGEVGLALGDTPLLQPTQVALPGSAEADAVAADNAARAIVLDDGAGTNYFNSQFLTPPYVSNDAPVRVGADATFTEPVVLTQGGSPSSPTYRFQPTVSVSGFPDYTTTSPAVFEDTRTDAPDAAALAAEGTPDVTVASFNVLNYFTTLGDADDDNVSEIGCSAYNDRDGDGNNVRGGCDPRGAWDPEDLERQQEKIVAAINALDADVVGLMEIENSAALGEDVDDAVETLVAALNADAGAGTWAANPSSAELPDASVQDVITNAIIYRPAAVERVGDARALGDQSETGEAFQNAREPIAQVFEPVAGGTPFLFVVNHFKSKGSVGPWPGDEEDGSGQGNSNESRVRQATALAEWVPTVQADSGVDATLLVGDFNAYAMEDPLQVLYDDGYTNVEDRLTVEEWSYSFSGQSGSLDHVLANEAAMSAFTGVDIWEINSGESVAMEYSRFNYHGTDFHDPGPFRSSDHDPVLMGLDLVSDVVEPADSTTTLKVRPKSPKARKGVLRIKVKVTTDADTQPTGTVKLNLPGTAHDQVVELDDKARAFVKIRKAFGKPGRKRVVAVYSGDDLVAGSRDKVVLKVRR